MMMVLFWTIVSLMILAALGFIIYPLRNSRIAVCLILLFIPIMALYLYSRVGDYQGLKEYKQLQDRSIQAKLILSNIKNTQQLIDQLKAHLQHNYSSAQGWFLLGKLYSDQHQWVQAKQAFHQAYQLSPHHESYILSDVQSDFFVNNKHLTLEDIALLAPILKRDPKNVMVINMLAIDAYLQHHYHTAVVYWERLLLIFPADSNDSKTVLQMIAKAQKSI